MTEQSFIQLAVSVVSAFSAFMAYLTSRKAISKVQEVHLLINSRLTELLEVSRQASHAAGVEEGTAAGRRQQARINDQISGHQDAAPTPDAE